VRRWIAATAITLAFAATSVAQDARELFEQGNAATEAGRFADARDLYRRSLELEPNPASAFNLAVALTRTGEFVEAATIFEELLEGSFGGLSRTQRREVRALRREASENVATLRVELPPVAEVEIRVDGKRIEGAVAHVDPGEHLVSVSSPRHRPVEDRVIVERGEERRYQPTLQLRPDLTMGRLVVEAPEGGHLSVDGVAEAMGRLDLDLEAGTYELSLRADGRATDREVVVEAGTTSRYEVTLAPRRRVWLWIVGAVLVAGGVATALVLTRTEQPPREDPVYGTISTLHF
jgi:hypothetical protein